MPPKVSQPVRHTPIDGILLAPLDVTPQVLDRRRREEL